MKYSVVEQLMYTTLRIESTKQDGSVSIGTGFIYRANEQINETGQEEFNQILITNNHVIENSIKSKIWFNIGDKEMNVFHGKQKSIEVEGENIWFKHSKVDLAFCGLYLPLELLKKQGFIPFLFGISNNIIPTNEYWIDILPSEEILMIGYPNGIWDSVHNLPLLRKGSIASIPYINYENRPEFVIDCACFPGSSGSPVFLTHFGKRLTRNGVEIDAFDTKFIGILYSGPVMKATGEIYQRIIPTNLASSTDIMINLGYCIKANQIDEFEEKVKQIILENQANGIIDHQKNIIDSI